MAKPAKRKVEGTTSGEGRSGGASASGASGGSAGSTATGSTSKRVTAKPDKRPAGRYTPPGTGGHKGPSPRWVPVLMFGLWAVGLAVIILNYMGVLPGSADGGNGWYLVAGLLSILAGIMVATQYR